MIGSSIIVRATGITIQSTYPEGRALNIAEAMMISNTDKRHVHDSLPTSSHFRVATMNIIRATTCLSATCFTACGI